MSFKAGDKAVLVDNSQGYKDVPIGSISVVTDPGNPGDPDSLFSLLLMRMVRRPPTGWVHPFSTRAEAEDEAERKTVSEIKAELKTFA